MGTRKNRLAAVLTSTHNLCFGAKIRKIGIPLRTPVLLYKSGVQGGIHYTDILMNMQRPYKVFYIVGSLEAQCRPLFNYMYLDSV